MDNLSITFSNFSDVEFQLAQKPYYSFGPGGDIAQIPDATLPNGHDTSMSANNQTMVGEAESTFNCIWYDSVNSIRFGIQIHVGTQPLGIGPQPVWFVMCDNQPADAPVQWSASGSTPASSYSWPSNLPYIITAVPDSGHETLNIQVNIQAAGSNVAGTSNSNN